MRMPEMRFPAWVAMERLIRLSLRTFIMNAIATAMTVTVTSERKSRKRMP